jgi:hypothetical protein
MKPTQRDKTLYRIWLYTLKMLPVLLLMLNLASSMLGYYGHDTYLISSIGGLSLVGIIFLYLSSYLFKFCRYHRVFLHSVGVLNLLNLYDWYIGIPIE